MPEENFLNSENKQDDYFAVSQNFNLCKPCYLERV